MTNRLRRRDWITGVSGLFTVSCGNREEPNELHVAAAANLRGVFEDLVRAYGGKVTPTFGATAQLAQQIENGAPIDLFLAADTQHVDQLLAKGIGSNRAVYARGQLVIWAPARPDIGNLQDLASNRVRQVGIARPELAPYGAAAVAALKKENLWATVEPKLVYAQSISAAKQFADSGNVDAAFTALSLVVRADDHYVILDQSFYPPIEQALCLVGDKAAARKFRDFVLSDEGRAILRRWGYKN